MKRILLLVALLALLPTTIFAQSTHNKIHDPYFKNGFYVVTPDVQADTVCSRLLIDSTATPVWTVRQYNSKFDISQNEYENIANRYLFKVPGNGNLFAKSLTVNPVRGSLTLECNASAEYKGIRRSDKPWVYLTVDAPTDTIALAGRNSVKLALSYKVLFYEDCMGFLADPGYHGATYRIALKLRNANRESVCYGESFRLVFVLFDNRFSGNTCTAKYSELPSPLGGDFAYYPVTNSYLPVTMNGRLPKVRQNVDMNIEVLHIIKKALANAVSDGLLDDTQMSDWEIVACDMGWEMTGTYNASMRVKNLQLTAQ